MPWWFYDLGWKNEAKHIFIAVSFRLTSRNLTKRFTQESSENHAKFNFSVRLRYPFLILTLNKMSAEELYSAHSLRTASFSNLSRLKEHRMIEFHVLNEFSCSHQTSLETLVKPTLIEIPFRISVERKMTAQNKKIWSINCNKTKNL